MAKILRFKIPIYLVLTALCIYGYVQEFNVVDHYFGVGEHFGFYVFHFFVCFALLAVAVIVHLVCRNRDGLLQKFNTVVLIFTVIFVLATCGIKWSYYTQQVDDIRDAGYVYEVGTLEVRDLLDQKKSAVLYVERQDCPSCQEAYSHIYRYAAEHHLELMLWNIARDNGDLDPAIKEELLDRLGVESVPTILTLEKGTVVERLLYEDILPAVPAP